MDPEFITLQNTVEGLTDRINELETERETLMETSGELNRDISTDTKDRIVEAVREQLFVEIWENSFIFSTVFESIDRYTVVSANVGTTGLLLDDTGGADSAALQAKFNNPIRSDRTTFAKLSVGIGDVSEAVFFATILGGGSGGNVAIGVNAGIIEGTTNDGTTTNTVTLGTLADATEAELEIRYFPRGRVDFFVDGVLSGSSATNLPLATNEPSDIMSFSLDPESGGSSATTAELTYFILHQQK